ncbi:type 2 lanthipeptide synthetase LanM family protein [Crossiella sp. SN42]|uniref:type 2 lanthipeptide synthetase LanM family protein n=1 Tax=Crossiella sp. SN42 TaxID=2944808 RepID=UPI00207C4CAA|nr:type 2 lanthipeptide synthetase LanM family protein [Crossiella sp. SN42]MCO1578039.1 type 2 lanthipeptide synthetase LanM family protein [Crossiella sp. SN42]
MSAVPDATRRARPEVLLDPSWWAPALALHERAEHGVPAHFGSRPRHWEQDGLDAAFALRLAELNLTEDGALALRAEPAPELAARMRKPGWASVAERAVRIAATLPGTSAEGLDWREALARPLRPFVLDAADRLAEGLATLPGTVLDLPRIADSFSAALSRRLFALAARTLVGELHRRRTEGRLRGADGQARFTDFAHQLTDATGLAELITGYPVLARLLAQTSANAAEATVELLGRLAADHAELVATLFHGIDPGPLVELEPGKGDPHRGGRSCTLLHFADQRKLIYKPRDPGAHLLLGKLLAWTGRHLPGLGLRAVPTVARDGYGWSAYLAGAPVADAAEAAEFYRKQGALLALLHAVQATDIHCENLIAEGDTPVLVDLETLFHPDLTGAPSTGDPAADALAASVHRTALLPLIVIGEQGALDMSGLGGDGGRTAPASAVDWADPGTDVMRLVRTARPFAGARNRPVLDGHPVDPAEHEGALLEGFRLVYDLITAHRDELVVLAASAADLPLRVVTRPTWVYATLLDETTHPSVLRDALDRDRALSVLWAGRSHPVLAQLLPQELAELWAGDVPLFTGAPGSAEIRTAQGKPLPVPLGRSGLAAALAAIGRFGEVDRQDQEWVICAALATRHPAGEHQDAAPLPGPRTGTAAEPDRLLAAASAVADQIVARGIPGGDRVNWLGLELVDDRQWLVLPMGAGLATGHVGVALFLAQLAAATGVPRYADTARRALRGIPDLLAALEVQPRLRAAVGCGGPQGLGGIAYGLARLATLLDADWLRAEAGTAVRLAGAAATEGADPSWATGTAGCLAAMRAVHAETGLAAAKTLAEACAEHLARCLRQGVELPGGFAHGFAGLAWALRLDGRHPDLAAEATRRSSAAGPGWCAGAAGLALATGATGALADQPVLRDLSLCHGELGVQEVLTVLEGPSAARRRRAGQALEALHRLGPACGAPAGVATPGLLNGLAGIGYGLLRLASPDHVPSVLLLQR